MLPGASRSSSVWAPPWALPAVIVAAVAAVALLIVVRRRQFIDLRVEVIIRMPPRLAVIWLRTDRQAEQPQVFL
jgi:hypothetical protein